MVLGLLKGMPNLNKELVLAINFFDLPTLQDIFALPTEDFLAQQLKNIIGRLMSVCANEGIKFRILIPEKLED
ncbi:MAG: hypothetical protein ACOYN2_03225 [Patescibacteria group bacterium]